MTTRVQHGPAVRRPVSGSAGPVLALVAAGWGANQFAPLIVLYRRLFELTPSSLNAMYGLYALGLVPALLAGGRLSDRVGRRAVVAPALLVSFAGSVLLLAAGDHSALLYAGRLVTGAGCGLIFGTGSAWLKELATGDDVRTAPRRATLAMTAGFAFGPLAAGAIAQWAPHPAVWAYVPQLVLAAVALLAVLATRDAPRGVAGANDDGTRGPFPAAAFFSLFVPFAPWVFGTAAVFLAYLTPLVAPVAGANALLFSAVAAGVGAAAGLAAQPVAGRWHRDGTDRLLRGAMAVVVAGLALAALAAGLRSLPVVLVVSVLLGFGYGLCQFCGLLNAQLIATPRSLGTVIAGYQVLSYVGFAFPYLMSRANDSLGTSPAITLAALTVLAAGCFVFLLVSRRRHPPARRD